MPAPQLHLTFGDLVQHNPLVPQVLRRACAREPIYTRLGSIFHDLPYYYAPILFEALRYGLGAQAIDEGWGYRVHSVRPGRLVASYLAASATCPAPLSTDERLALCGGLLSHCALDLTLHPLVNYCARRDVVQHGGHESTLHRMTEKYHALFFHLERFGDDPIGTAAFAERCRITKQGGALDRLVEAPLLAFMSLAFRGAYGRAPAERTWASWVRNFRQFGLAVSIPIAARNSHRTRTAAFRERFYHNEVFDFRDFYAAAERRMGQLALLSLAFLEAEDFSPEAQIRFAAVAGIDDLAEPLPVDLPALPRLEPMRGTRPLLMRRAAPRSALRARGRTAAPAPIA